MGFFDFLRPAQRSTAKAPGENNRLLVIPVDETKQSLHALEWAIGNVYKQETDQLHLLSVVPRVAGPYPAEIVETDVPAAASSAVKAWRSEQHAREAETLALLTYMQHAALNLGVKPGSIRVAARTATGGASGVGASVADYVLEANADMVVLGSRGLHGWQRHVQNLLGFGSVSYYTMLRVPCPVVVVKHEDATD
eukprot:jgi/Sobl393_1/19105/SZX64285.1